MKTIAAVPLVRGFLIALAIAIPLALIGSTASSESTKLVIAPDLAQRLAKFKKVHMPFDSSGLTDREKQMVAKLVDASGLLDCIYWRQSDPEGLKLYLSLAHSGGSTRDHMVAEYLKINGGRFDLIDDNKPFVGTEPVPPGRGFFPGAPVDLELAKAEIDGLIEHVPAMKAAVYSPYTIVVGLGPGARNMPPKYTGKYGPRAIPYHVAFAQFLKPMAADLRAAADLSDDPAFANFLRLRADALLTDDYYKSDIAWLDLKDPKFDVIFAPYEVYLDGLLGVKTSYGASVMIRNDAESKKVEVFQKYVPELQESLALPAADLPSKHGKQSPMEVVDGVYRAGDLLHGYQAVADNLPNDPRIHEEKGSKKMFWQNFMDARVNYIILPLAKQLMRPDQAKIANTEGLMDFVILHEVSHGLGPSFAHTAAGKVGVGEAIGPQYSSLEESKADMTSMHNVKWLVDHGVIPKSKLDGIYASYLAETFRTIRFGIAEAHGQGSMMQLSYLIEQGAIRRDSSTGRYEADFDKFPAAIESLDKELLEQEATGDRARAEAWFKKYAVMPPELTAALAKSSNVPVDVDPEFDFHPPLR
ncbi:MAG: Zn-dependent hydrolase [Candidatus Acidiferrales bacterium]